KFPISGVYYHCLLLSGRFAPTKPTRHDSLLPCTTRFIERSQCLERIAGQDSPIVPGPELGDEGGVERVAERTNGAVREQARHGAGVSGTCQLLHVGDGVAIPLKSLRGIAVVLPAAAVEPAHVRGERGIVVGGRAAAEIILWRQALVSQQERIR